MKNTTKKIRRVVIKVGTSVLTNADGALDMRQMHNLASAIMKLRERATEVVLVTSGAIACGMNSLGLKHRPSALAELQAAASVGQIRLMDIYAELFSKNNLHIAQILLTAEDLNARARYLNAKNTINTLLKSGVIPIVNENDTVSTDEIKFGDNDKLASLVACLIEADELIILSDVAGLCRKKDARKYEELIPVIVNIDEDLENLACGSGSELSKGGMLSKLQAAKVAQSAGILCVLADGRAKDILIKIVDKGYDRDGFSREPVGSAFFPKERLVARKRWLAFASRPAGAIIIDAGAADALLARGSSLLASGITRCEGSFQLGDMVLIKDAQEKELARGLANYTSDEVNKIKGKKTKQIKELLGYKDYDEVVHRDNLVIL